MIRNYLLLVTVTSVFTVFADQSGAQISFGVTRQNGVVTGGGFQLGGFVTPGRTGVVLGISGGASQLIGVQSFRFQNGGGNVAMNGANSARRNRPPTPQQFVQAAGRFDRDGDRRLDRKELAQVAAAVMEELRRQGRNPMALSAQSAGGGTANPMPSTPSAEQIVETFVTRCMTFDADEDDALNAAETRRMAAALIRSLS